MAFVDRLVVESRRPFSQNQYHVQADKSALWSITATPNDEKG